MSQSDQSRPPTAGVWEPAFPPVVIAEEQEGLTRYLVRPGLTKLELATVLVMSNTTAASAEVMDADQVAELAAWCAFVAETALEAAAKRQRVAAAVEERKYQLETGTVPIRPDRAAPAADQPGAVERVAELVQYLADTHQLNRFAQWSEIRQRGDVYDPIEADRMIRRSDADRATEGG